MTDIRSLIDQTQEWLEQHRKAGRSVDAVCCHVRLVALKQCLRIVKDSD